MDKRNKFLTTVRTNEIIFPIIIWIHIIVHFLPTGSLVNLKDKTGAGAGADIPDEKVSDNSSGVDANIDDTIINDDLKTKKKRRRIKGRRRKNSLPRRGPSRDPPRDSLRESSRESGSLRDPSKDSSRDSSRDSNR